MLLCMCLVMGTAAMSAAGYITDVMALGVKSGKGNALKNQYRELGWTVLDQDLNEGAGGWDIYIAYKTSSTANPETGYITDICVSTEWKDRPVLDGRTYHHVSTNSGFNGDLNAEAGGEYIWMYYTRDRAGLSGYGGTQRVMTELSTTDEKDDGKKATDGVRWRWSKRSGIADMNESAGGDDIFIQMHFTTQKLSIKNDPQAAENIVYDGTPQLLVPNNPSGNYGTMKYRVGTGGSFSSSLPRATEVGTYTVYYLLDGSNYASRLLVSLL